MEIDFSSLNIYHYVYRLDCLSNGLFYFGVRSTYSDPEYDFYFGSGNFPKKAKKNGWTIRKTVISLCHNRIDAERLERELILSNKNNDLCDNVNHKSYSKSITIKQSDYIPTNSKERVVCLNGHDFSKETRSNNGSCKICLQNKWKIKKENNRNYKAIKDLYS